MSKAPRQDREGQAAGPSASTPSGPRPRRPASARRFAPRLSWLVVLLVGVLVGRYGCGPAGAPPGVGDPSTSEAPAATVIWTCAMHPQIRLPEPGSCPICGMDLVPLEEDADDDAPAAARLSLSPAAVALADIVTAPVERRAVTHEVRMVGKVGFDETRMASITAWVPGRLDRLFVDYTGVTVRKGDHLVEIYSPLLLATQQELLQAVATARLLASAAGEADGSAALVAERTSASVTSARERLRLWGLESAQIDEIIEQGKPSEHITIRAPMGGVVVHKNALEGTYVETGTRIYTIADLSRVWVLLDAYESDLAWLRYGERIEFRAEAWPGEAFEGRIAFIDPVLDDRTRTVKVRVNVANPDLRLKPDMFVRAVVRARLTAHGRVIDADLAGRFMCPMHPEVVADEPGACDQCGMDLVPASELGFTAEVPEDEPTPLVVPASAPLITGKRAVVYVAVPDAERPTFEGREVVLGPRAGDHYVVASGLAEGERVVVRGNFKLDSELQIRARPSMMNPAGGVPPPGHDHGVEGGAGGGAGARGAGRPTPSAAPAMRHALPAGAAADALVAVLDAAVGLQAALAADDAEGASTAADALRAALGVAEHAAHAIPLSPEAVSAWGEGWRATDAAAAAWSAAPTLERRRTLFAPLSEALIAWTERFGSPDVNRRDLGVFHCPMALEGDGARWIQAGDDTANPYLGAAMLRCGDRVADLGSR